MLSSEGKVNDREQLELQVPMTTQVPDEPESDTSREQPGDREQIFSLIDRLLSLEACLHHQIVPLGLKNNKLLVGIVNPQDKEALDYVSRLVSYVNCTMVTKPIANAIHRTILSSYLQYKNTSLYDATQQYQLKVDFASKNKTVPFVDQLNSSATTYSELDQQLTFVEDMTEIPSISDSQADLSPILNPNNWSGTTNSASIYDSKAKKTPEVLLSSNLNILPLEIPDILSPIEELVTLSPRNLLEELLARVLLGGISRLYLERQHDQGRILWSDNGVLQSIIENLPLSVFLEVMKELKQFAGLPIATLVEAKQVEKELLYQNNSLLLRLRVMPEIYGEEATLQVLRGEALRFYQQQQLSHLSHDTLVMTQQLKLKLHELEKRLLLSPNLQSDQLQAVIALSHLVENLDKHLNVFTGDSQPPQNTK